MQLRAQDSSAEEGTYKSKVHAEPQLTEALRDHEARRCHICQRKYPGFGFGPKLTHTGHTIWSCMIHRDEVERLLRDQQIRPGEKRQAGLFDRDSPSLQTKPGEP